MVFSLVILRKLWYPVTEVMTMASKAAIKRIIETLKELYPDALCSLQYEKDYELLFAVRLSAQCTDERVNKVTPALFARFPTLESFAEADPKEVGEYIHSCGFFNGKLLFKKLVRFFLRFPLLFQFVNLVINRVCLLLDFLFGMTNVPVYPFFQLRQEVFGRATAATAAAAAFLRA